MEVVETLNRANRLLKTGIFEKIFGGFGKWTEYLVIYGIIAYVVILGLLCVSVHRYDP